MKKWAHIIILALFANPGYLTAQSIDYEFLLWGGGGAAGLYYTPAGGTTNIRMGFQGGLGYAYFPHEQWSIVTGLEVASYNTAAAMFDNVVMASPAVDNVTGELFEWRVRTTGYEERQTAYMLNVPLKLQFQTARKKTKLNFYVQAGIKVGFPQSTHYSVSAKTLETSGYFPLGGKEIKNTPGDGFGTLTDWRQEGIFTLRTSYSATAEAGVKYDLPKDIRIYLGIYFDYGYNNVRRESMFGTIFLHRPGALTPKRPGNSVVNVGGVTDRIKMMALGLKVTLAIGGVEEPIRAVRYYQCRCGQ